MKELVKFEARETEERNRRAYQDSWLIFSGNKINSFELCAAVFTNFWWISIKVWIIVFLRNREDIVDVEERLQIENDERVSFNG